MHHGASLSTATNFPISVGVHACAIHHVLSISSQSLLYHLPIMCPRKPSVHRSPSMLQFGSHQLSCVFGVQLIRWSRFHPQHKCTTSRQSFHHTCNKAKSQSLPSESHCTIRPPSLFTRSISTMFPLTWVHNQCTISLPWVHHQFTAHHQFTSCASVHCQPTFHHQFIISSPSVDISYTSV